MCIKYSGESNGLVGYSDLDFANDIGTRKSTTRYLFMMIGGSITWSSQKQKTIVLSTTETEYVAASAYLRGQILYDISKFFCL